MFHRTFDLNGRAKEDSSPAADLERDLTHRRILDVILSGVAANTGLFPRTASPCVAVLPRRWPWA